MKDMADKLVDLGLARLGYEYLCVDGEQTVLLDIIVVQGKPCHTAWAAWACLPLLPAV